jgi:hypothetical protein
MKRELVRGHNEKNTVFSWIVSFAFGVRDGEFSEVSGGDVP